MGYYSRLETDDDRVRQIPILVTTSTIFHYCHTYEHLDNRLILNIVVKYEFYQSDHIPGRYGCEESIVLVSFPTALFTMYSFVILSRPITHLTFCCRSTFLIFLLPYFLMLVKSKIQIPLKNMTK